MGIEEGRKGKIGSLLLSGVRGEKKKEGRKGKNDGGYRGV